MLLARPRRLLLAFLAAPFVNCNEEPPPTTVLPTPTSVIVLPESFLGDVACGTEPGGLLSYQATLLKVTGGLTDAPALPASPVVDCTSSIVFETVEIDERYIAIIRAFDRADLTAESEGSETVVDGDGNPVAPRWTTRCLGHDGEAEQALGGAGGEGGSPVNTSLGVLAVEHSAVPVRGCAPLTGTFDPNLTGLRVEPASFLGSLSCGDAAGQVYDYAVTAGDMPGSAGGAAGMGGASSGAERTACELPLTVRGLPAAEWVTLEVSAFELGATEPSWTASCEARTQLGAVVLASCHPLRED